MKKTEEQIFQLSLTTGLDSASLKIDKKSKRELIKKHLFAINQPFIFKENGHRIAEYKDGRKKIIR